YFNTHFDTISFENMRFNFIRDRGTIRISTSYHNIAGVNYCKFNSDFEKDFIYYAYVMDYQYINDNTTELTLLIDGIMTVGQGDTLSKFNDLSVTRKHLRKSVYNKRLTELKNNDDVIKTYTISYTDTENLLFDELYLLMQVSCSLTAVIGKVDDFKIDISTCI